MSERRRMAAMMSVRVPAEMAQAVTAAAAAEGVSAGAWARRAVSAALERPPGVVPGSGRMVVPQVSPPVAAGACRVFRCAHAMVSGPLTEVTCPWGCGPLEGVA